MERVRGLHGLGLIEKSKSVESIQSVVKKRLNLIIGIDRIVCKRGNRNE